jgi:hypothetical protein
VLGAQVLGIAAWFLLFRKRKDAGDELKRPLDSERASILEAYEAAARVQPFPAPAAPAPINPPQSPAVQPASADTAPMPQATYTPAPASLSPSRDADAKSPSVAP